MAPGCAPCTPIRVPHRWWCGIRRSAAIARLLGRPSPRRHVPTWLPVRAPHSADVTNADVLADGARRNCVGALGFTALRLLPPAVLGPTSRLFATGATIVTGYPFLRGALRSLRGGRSVGHRRPGLGGHHRQPGPARERGRADRAVAAQHRRVPSGPDASADPSRDRGSAAWHRRTPRGSGWPTAPRSRSPSTPCSIGDEVVVHDHVAIPVDGVVVDGEAIVDQSAITGETLPSPARRRAASTPVRCVIRGRLVIRAERRRQRHHHRPDHHPRRTGPARPGAHPDHRRELLPALRARLLPVVRADPRRHPRRAPRHDHAACRLPLRGRAGHPDRDQRGDRQRRPPRHPDQGRLPPGAGRPRRRRRLRQDRHPHHRPPRRHQHRCLPQGLAARGGAGLRGELGDPLSTSPGRSRHPVHRRTPHRHPAARGMRGPGRPRHAHPGRRSHAAAGQPRAAAPARRSG